MSWPLNIHEASVVESEIPTLHQKCNRTYYTNFLNILIVLKLKKRKEIKHLDGFPCVYTNDEDPEEFIMVMTLSQMVAQMSRNEKSWSHKA